MVGKVPAVYDIELAFRETDPVRPTMMNLLHGRKVTAHIYMNRIPLEELPQKEDDLDEFLREMFQRKASWVVFCVWRLVTVCGNF